MCWKKQFKNFISDTDLFLKDVEKQNTPSKFRQQEEATSHRIKMLRDGKACVKEGKK